MENCTIEQELVQVIREVSEECAGPRTLPGHFDAHYHVGPVDITIEPFSRGAMTSVNSRDYFTSEGIRTPVETYVDGIALERSPLGPTCDGETARLASLIRFDNGREACSVLGKALGVNVEYACSNLLDIILLLRWASRPEPLSEVPGTPFHNHKREDAWNAMMRLGHDAIGSQVGLDIVAEIFRDGWLGRCKSVRRCLAQHPEIAAMAIGNAAFPRLTDPNILCTFLSHPDAFSAMLSMAQIDPYGEMLAEFVDLYGEKATFEGLIKVLGDSLSPSRWRVVIGTDQVRQSDLEDAKEMIASLHDRGVSAAKALRTFAWLPPENKAYEYSPSQRSLEGQFGRYTFHLPKDTYEMVYLGALLHNCLGSLIIEQPADSTVFYATDGNEGDRVCAAVQIDTQCGWIKAEALSCNRLTWFCPELERSIDDLSRQAKAA